MRTEIIKCDRCGKELVDEVVKYELRLPTHGSYTIGEDNVIKLNLIPQDLCKQCMEELVDWMNKEK